ncbi:hypothetical protein L3Y34_017210 [Caenorhabditis briggsae]|nr:hypothetical protein L3Y34_017210 [Caenorhabditis briggsae]
MDSPILEKPEVTGYRPENWSQHLLESRPEDNSNTSSVVCDKRLVGYYTDYTRAIIRNEQILKLTHVIYLLLDVYPNGVVKVLDEQKDTSFLKKVEFAKRLNPKLKVMVGVGGYQFARRFSSVAGDETKRQTFQISVTAFLIYHKLDGVDIFWAWPKAEDRENCLKLIKGLRQNLPAQFLISMILPRLAQQLDGYILNSLVDYVDFFSVLSYDYFGPLPGNDANLGPISPLYGGQRGNVDGTMKRLSCEIRKPSQLNMGITLYGTYWSNVESGLGQKTDDIWRLAEVENGPGYSIGWREMEQRNWNLSSANWHEASKSSYIWNPKNKKLLGFENEKSLQEKVVYAKNKNIGGIVVWTMDQDDVVIDGCSD